MFFESFFQISLPPASCFHSWLQKPVGSRRLSVGQSLFVLFTQTDAGSEKALTCGDSDQLFSQTKYFGLNSNNFNSNFTRFAPLSIDGDAMYHLFKVPSLQSLFWFISNEGLISTWTPFRSKVTDLIQQVFNAWWDGGLRFGTQKHVIQL